MVSDVIFVTVIIIINGNIALHTCGYHGSKTFPLYHHNIYLFVFVRQQTASVVALAIGVCGLNLST